MSIKDALEGRPQFVGMEKWMPEYKRIGYENKYRAMLLEIGSSLLKKAGAPEVLTELEEAIKPRYPDVVIGKSTLGNDGLVYIPADWNNRHEIRYRPDFPDRVHSQISIIAYPLTSDLIVIGDVGELLKEEQWQSNRKFLEDAVVEAYRKPKISSGWITR